MKEELSDLLDSKVRFHDKHRFEIKLDLTLHEGKEDSYHIDTYFFIPKSLNVGPHTFSKHDFYNNCQRYVRYRAPRFDFGMLLDPGLESSPLHRLRDAIPSLLAGKKDRVETVIYELRMLGSICRASLRDQVRSLYDEIESLKGEAGKAKLSTITDGVRGVIEDVKKLADTLRGIRLEVSKPVVPVRVRDAFLCADEFLSLSFVDHLTILLHAIREGGVRSELLETAEAIADFIIAQNEYRVAMGYPSVAVKGARNEIIGYRRGVLKKYVSAPLFLRIETSEWEGTSQIFYGFAAGVAMLWTVLVMMLARTRYAINSTAFVVAAVGSYIFKDRIKDWLKLWLVKKWTRWIADRDSRIWDPETKENIGRLREAFSFLSAHRVPHEIHRCRNVDNITSLDEEGKPEWVMKYEKEVRLYPAKIAASHERVNDINDILRFNIFPFLAGTDDPGWDYWSVDKKTKELERIPCSRVYHINLVRRFTVTDAEGRQQTGFDRFRIVFDREGIIRVEEAPVV